MDLTNTKMSLPIRPETEDTTHIMVHQNLLAAIGNTPLVNLELPTPGTVYAKLEYLNPGGSVKDRSALFMVEEAERSGKLKQGGVIIDASSGNHGIAIAMIGAIKGYRVIITVSEKISQEKLQAIKAYGAEVIMCPSTAFIEDPRSYHSQAVALHKKTPHSFMPDQYFNVDNAHAHYALLAPEIWQQTGGTITHFFACAGTGGTISGVGRYLKEKNPAIQIIAIDSANSFKATHGNPKPYKIEGMGIDWDSPVLNHKVIDEFIAVTDEDSIAMLKTLARRGFLTGGSSGAVAHAALEYARTTLQPHHKAVIIFGDSGRAYLTKNFY